MSGGTARDWYPPIMLALLVAQIAGGLANAVEWTFGGAPSAIGIVASLLGPALWVASGWLLGRLHDRGFLLLSAGFWGLTALAGLVVVTPTFPAPDWLAGMISVVFGCPAHGLTAIVGGPGGLTLAAGLVLALICVAWLLGRRFGGWRAASG